MNAERWQVVKSVLGRIMDLSEAERDAQLGEVEERDPELAREVRRLLRNHQPTDGFLETPAAVSLLRSDSDPGDTVAGYRVLGVLGEGGMGVVYRAEQQHPRRVVALKVIRPGVATETMLRRFELEAEMLARLQHPGIAQVFEAGTYVPPGLSTVQPFFAMELVEGDSLTAHADRLAMRPRERLELFIHVCEAVQHAHMKGVIHRDLKPANIIVTADGQPKILDFGVARVADSNARATLSSTAGQIVGTVPYMSPEQIAGEDSAIDTRSDVYSLGVILYELLAGKLPHDVERKSVAEAARIIQFEPPRPISALRPALRGDLETITRTSLEKDRQRRYQSASELAADVGRFLRHEALLARRPGSIYLLRKFVRRNRAAVAGAAGVFIVLLAGLWFIAGQRDLARREAAKAVGVDTFLREIFDSINPNNARGRQVTVREMLDQAAARLEQSPPEEPEVAAIVHETIGNTYWRIGELAGAERHLKAALEAGTPAMGRDHPRLLNATNTLAMVYKDAGRLNDSGQLVQQVYEARLRTLGPEHKETLSSMNNMARWLGTQGKHDEGIALMRRVVELRSRIEGTDDRTTLASRDNVGRMLMSAGRLEEAEAHIRAALLDFERVLGADDPDTLVAVNNLANVLHLQKRSAEAEPLARRAVAERARVLGERNLMTCGSRVLLGRILLELERPTEAESELRIGADAAEEAQAAVRGAWRSLHGDALAAAGNHASARAAYERAYASLEGDPQAAPSRAAIAAKIASACEAVKDTEAASRWRAASAGSIRP